MNKPKTSHCLEVDSIRQFVDEDAHNISSTQAQ